MEDLEVDMELQRELQTPGGGGGGGPAYFGDQGCIIVQEFPRPIIYLTRYGTFATNPGTNTVIDVIVVRDVKLLDENGQESESVGLQFLRDTVENGEDRTWVQTSYNNNFRTRYAAADDCYYDLDHDAFVLSEGRYFLQLDF